MCRMAAFPPFFPQDEAKKILGEFVRGNIDGTGSVYVKDGAFVVNKWASSLYRVYKENLPLLSHMPYDGWTLVHLRAASHGTNTYNNTHPFVKGKWALCHNGVWRDYSIVKAAYSRLFTFKGETDSEVAAQLFATAGPRNFIRAVKDGVYLSLHRSGKLYAICSELGDLEFAKTKYGIVLASSLPTTYEDVTTLESGWLKFNSKGTLIKHDFKKQKYITAYPAGKGLYSEGHWTVDGDFCHKNNCSCPSRKELAKFDKLDKTRVVPFSEASRDSEKEI